MVINHFTVEHRLVIDPPVDVAICRLRSTRNVADSEPRRLLSPVAGSPRSGAGAAAHSVRSGVNILEGSAVDPSGVSSLRVQILDPTGDTSDTTCQWQRQ